MKLESISEQEIASIGKLIDEIKSTGIPPDEWWLDPVSNGAQAQLDSCQKQVDELVEEILNILRCYNNANYFYLLKSVLKKFLKGQDLKQKYGAKRR